MTIYYGIVKGRTIVLSDPTQFEEGTVVEVRPITGRGDGAELESDLQMQQALFQAGLVDTVSEPGDSPVAPDPLPLRISGPPVSETIIAERR